MTLEVAPSQDPETPPSDAAAMHARVLRGSVWTLAGIGASRVVRLANNLILTRLMPAAPIGIMLLANTLITGLQMFSDIGTRPAIIQSRRGEDPDFLNTAWTMSVIRGFILWGLACILALPYSWFYQQPMLAVLVPVIGSTAAIAGFQTTAFATANRKLALGRLTLLEFVAQVVGSGTVLIWAYFDPSPWALVAGGVSNAIVFLVLGFLWLPGIKHRLRWDRESARELIAFGRWVFVSTSITFLASQCDPIVLGRIAMVFAANAQQAAAALAIYGIGKMWGMMASEVFQQLLSRVFFPVMSEMVRTGKLDRDRICELRTRLLLPVAIGTGALFVIAEPSIRFLYKPEYWGAGPIFALSAVAAWVGTITNTYGIVLLSAARLKNMTASTATKAAVFFALAYPAYVEWKLEGIAIAVIAAEVCALAPMMWGAHRINVAMPLRELALTVIGAVYGVAMYGVYTGTVTLVRSDIVGVAVVGVLTGAACLWCVKSLFAHLKRAS